MLDRNKSTQMVWLGSVMFILVTMFAVVPVEAEPDIKYGLWETTIKTEMAGIPMQQPAVTHTQCLTKENNVPENSPPDSECKMVEKRKSLPHF